ncbi:MAG: hypothetical protein CFE45_20245 [Burkholderiales bacterium PBB5]|nr:MAG: hypothetical protein CFE45_20245 [Burkholderiales bacterium PBB5]
MKQVQVMAAVAAWALVGAASAAEQRYVVLGAADSLTLSDYVEVWGVGSTSRYANPATEVGDPFRFLLDSRLGTTDVPQASTTLGPSLSFGYDPTATDFFTSVSGRSKRYVGGTSLLSVPVASGDPVTLASTSNTVTMSVSAAHKTQGFNFFSAAPTVDGPLPGSTLNFSVPAASVATYNVDLVSLLGPSASSEPGSFDLSGFTVLPVRLTSPSAFRPVGVGVTLQHFDAAGGLDPVLPTSLDDSSFSSGGHISVIFDGVFTVAVNAADYASTADYSAAKTWVDTNIRQINVESSVDWRISTLTPVPEPTAAWLLLLGLPLVLARRGAGRPPAAPTAGR